MNAKSRGLLIAGNWKMNNGLRETEAFFTTLKEKADSYLKNDHALFQQNSLRACLIPPYLSLQKATACAAHVSFPISIAAQNAHWEKKGAFTGEISGEMLSEIGIRSVLVGHSERRQYFGETDLTVQKRTESLLSQGFQVILCVGETRTQRDQGETEKILSQQLNGAIPNPGQGAATFLTGQLVIAYEPVWAIGTGVNATPAQAEEVHQFIRKFIWNRFGMESAGRTPLLYGGSVTPENSDALLSCPNIDGGLVGGASLKPENFLALLQSAARVLKN